MMNSAVSLYELVFDELDSPLFAVIGLFNY